MHTQRTLFVMEALMRSDVPDILSFLDLALDELVSLSESTQSSTKSKATKVRVGGAYTSHDSHVTRNGMR